jgi:hypothetical protein
MTHTHPLYVHAERAERASRDYTDRAAQFAHEREQKTPTDNVFTIHSLREVTHLHDLERECYDAMFTCVAIMQRANMRAYQHRQLVAVCNTKTRTPVARFTLAQVAAQHTYEEKLSRDNAPPGHLVTLSPIATCAASNAPGLVRHAITTGDTATT